MIILDPDGLFNGDRIRACSNEAQLHFHRLLLISNGYGRLELNYLKVIGAAYATFRPPPSEADFFSWIQQYVDNHLLFPYRSDGQLWGQWDIAPRLLPRYRTAKDRRSPMPSPTELNTWKEAYLTEKASFPKFSENFPKFSENLRIAVAVADAVAVVDKPNTCASQPDAQQVDLIPSSPKPPNPQIAWFDSWWDAYWLKKAKTAGWKAFQRAVKTEERFKVVMAALKAQTPEMLRRDPDKRPYPATWLNGERWRDEIESKQQDINVGYDRI